MAPRSRLSSGGGAAGGHLPSRPPRRPSEVYASEAANCVCQESLQTHGGNGFHDNYEISGLYREVRVTKIYEGTSEMQRMVIARSLLGR